jgi:predicted membrane protein
MDTDRFDDRRARYEQKMAERRQRWEERRTRRFYRSHNHGIFFGVVVVAIGCLLLLDNLGIFRFRDIWQYWPVLLIVWGLSHLIESRTPSGWVWGGMIALIGALFLLDNLDIFVFNFAVVWPVLLIAFGVTVLLGALERRQYNQQYNASGPSYAAAPMIGSHAFFSENRTGSDAQDFQGGAASAIFGAARFDLRNASMSTDEARIHVDVIFGEAEVRIPETWNVISRAAVIFGGIDDKTIHPKPDPNVKTPRLVITGSVIFGAITLRN